MRWIASIFFAVGLAAAAPAELSAQTTGRMAVGAGISTKAAPRGDSRGTTGVSLVWRLGHGDEGWGWKYGFNWYSAGLDRSLGGQSREFGKLRVKSFLGGYGYTRTIRGAKASANIFGGYGFTTFTLHDGFERAYLTTHGVESVEVKMSGTWVVKPELSVWFDLSRKVGLNLSAGYLIARPTLTVANPIRQETSRAVGDMFIVRIGAAYSIF